MALPTSGCPMVTNSLSKNPRMANGKTTTTPVNTKLAEGSWLVLKSSPEPPFKLRVFGLGPFLVVKRINRELALRGQQDFRITVAHALLYFESAPNLKISR